MHKIIKTEVGFTGIEFEKRILGTDVCRWQPRVYRVYQPEDFGSIVREFLQSNHASASCSDLKEVKLILHYVRRYLKSLTLTLEGELRLVSTRGTVLDRLFGTDALLFTRLNGIDCVVSIDVYAASIEKTQEKRRESCCYSDFQSRIYRMKLEKLLDDSSIGLYRKEYCKACIKNGRPSNHFLLIPDDIQRPRGLKEFSRHVAVSLWQQVFEERVHLKYCSISGFSYPVAG